MIGKTGALLYLRQPFVYPSNYFTDGVLGAGVNLNRENAMPIYSGVKSASRTLDENNYKSKINVSYATGSAGFFNSIETVHGGIHLDTIHIGRVFNRALEPSTTDCFFNTGNMGSSNGTVTPKIPVNWTPPYLDGGYPKADVFLLQALNTGATGTAKFRYAEYPYHSGYKCDCPVYSNRDYKAMSTGSWFWGEQVSLKYGNQTVTANVGNHEMTVSGIWAENRYISKTESITFVLSTDKQTIKFYADPSLTKLDEEITTTDGTSSVNLEALTYADGVLYGMSTSKVYSINVTTGMVTEISAAAQSGTDIMLCASPDQTRVYCISDGNVKIIHTADGSVTSPANSLPSSPKAGDMFSKFVVDEENNIWYNTKKYNGDTIADIQSCFATLKQMYFPAYFMTCGSYHANPVTLYDLDFNLVYSFSTTYHANYNSSIVARNVTTKGVGGSNIMVEVLHLETLKRHHLYSSTQKDWLVHDGSSWVKGWYADEVPTGDIDSSNKTFTCQNVPTDLLAGKLSIVVDGGSAITDNGDGTLSDGGTVTYSTGEFTLNAAPTTSVTVYYELTSDAVTGTDIALQDGVVVDFEDGVEAPHFVKDDYFSFTIAEGHIVDNLEAYTASVDLYVVPFFDISDETFTISATEMDAAAVVLTGFIKIDSDIGLTGTIAGTEATIITTGDPTAGQIKVDYDSGALTFHADDTSKTATITYRWLQRPE